MKTIGYDSYTSWLVAAGCCVIFCMGLTPYRLAGLIFVLITEYYETTRETATIPILFFLVIRCLGGPVLGVLGEKFGVELVTVIGCVLTAVGFGTSFYAQNIIGLSLLLGVIYGVGLALNNAYLPSIIKKHFKKNFTTANGIAQAGSCIGAVFVPPVATFLIDLYGVSGAFLILSGIMLNAIPIGIYVMKASALQESLIKYHANTNKSFKEEEKATYEIKQKISNDAALIARKRSGNIQFVENIEPSNKNCQKVSKWSDVVAQDGLELHKENLEIRAVTIEITSRDKVSPDRQTSNKENHKSCAMTSTGLDKIENSKNTLPIVSDLKDNRNLYGLGVFMDLSYLIIMLNIGLATYVSTMFWTTMIDYSRDKGISRSLEIYFLMLQPLFGLIGRIAFGWVTDLGYLSLANFAMLCYGQMALSMVLIVWTNYFGVMMVGACWYAITSGAIGVVYPGIIFKCIDKKHQTMAITSRFSLYGVLTFTSSPLIGFFRENLGSYDGFYCLLIVLCILCAAIVPLMFKFTKVRNSATNES